MSKANPRSDKKSDSEASEDAPEPAAADFMDIQAAEKDGGVRDKPVATAKSAPPPRAKKSKTGSAKGGSKLLSDQKLEQLREAVAAAGDANNLLKILEHVELAGGPTEVIQSIETYRALRAAVEVDGSTSGS